MPLLRCMKGLRAFHLQRAVGTGWLRANAWSPVRPQDSSRIAGSVLSGMSSMKFFNSAIVDSDTLDRLMASSRNSIHDESGGKWRRMRYPGLVPVSAMAFPRAAWSGRSIVFGMRGPRICGLGVFFE